MVDYKNENKLINTLFSKQKNMLRDVESLTALPQQIYHIFRITKG